MRAEHSGMLRRKMEQTSLSHTWPDLFTYFDLVVKYNLRVLTYPADILAAFDGLTSSLSEIFDGGFLWGSPEMFFDIALLWKAISAEKRVSDNSSNARSIPSWSWMALKGNIAIGSGKSGMGYLLKGPGIRPSAVTIDIIPTIQWYSIEKAGTERRPILSIWKEYENINDGNKLKTLLPGWNLHHDGFMGRYFTHKSDLNTKFRHPIPIQEQPPQPMLGTPGNLISCHTQRSFLFLPQAADTYAAQEEFEFSLLRTRSLLTKNEEWAGCLYMDNQAAGQAMVGVCEMIAISAGYESNREATQSHRMWIVDKSLHSRSTFEYLNVLWIEWEDGIAYRKGVGKVLKDRWETLELEWIDVVLG